jgi:hypothetical protein
MAGFLTVGSAAALQEISFQGERKSAHFIALARWRARR